MSKYWAKAEFKTLNDNLDKLERALGEMAVIQTDDILGRIKQLQKTAEEANKIKMSKKVK